MRCKELILFSFVKLPPRLTHQSAGQSYQPVRLELDPLILAEVFSRIEAIDCSAILSNLLIWPFAFEKSDSAH